MPDCCSKISETTYLRECPGNNTPNLPHREALDAAEMHQYDTIGYFTEPCGFLYFYYVKSLSTRAWPDRLQGREKEIKARSFDCIFYQIHPKI